MRWKRHGFVLTGALSAALLATVGTSAFAQATGTIRGTVTDGGTGAGIGEVQLTVIGSRRGTLSGIDGRFTITGVPTGPVRVRAQRIGYAPVEHPATVAAGQAATVDFSMTVASLTLDEMVVTGTPGATEKKVLGNVVSSVKAADAVVAASPPDVTELLQGKTAGINVRDNSGAVGTSTNIIIRGISSLSANANPVVYIDGVRMNSAAQSSNGTSGGTQQATSSMSAIDPNDIESIEVIKGPAASTLYGADAASGVIQIITKKGRLGQQSLQWNLKAEDGPIDWNVTRLKRYWYCTDAEIPGAPGATTKSAGTTAQPLFPNCASLGTNPSDSQRLLVDDPGNQPGALRRGNANDQTLSVRGGADRYSYFGSYNRDAENGVFYNNYFRRSTGRANFQVSLLDNLDITTSASYGQTGANEPLTDNSSNGIIRNWYRDRPSGPYQFETMFRGFGPALANQWSDVVSTDRFIGSTTVNYSPKSWFHNNLVLGADVLNQQNANFFPIDTSGKAVWGAQMANGWIQDQLLPTHIYTVTYSGTVVTSLPKSLVSTASVGTQYIDTHSDSWTTTGQGLVANSLNLVGAAAITTANQSFSEQKSFGTYVQEQVGWRDRLFGTAAVRVDNNSAFGSNFKWVTYPKLSASYVISDESFFHLPNVDQLKLRAAWGEAGNAPAPFTALRAYTTTQAVVGEVPVNALTPQSYGNPSLHAETGSEIEGGFDASMFRQRLGIEVTYYSKLTKSALITLNAPPSTGYTGTYLANIGEIKNAGVELTLTGSVIQTRNLSWDSQLNLSTNANRLVSWGSSALSNQVFGTFANAQEFAEGFPLGAFFGTDVQRDAHGNPVLTNGLVTLDPVTCTASGCTGKGALQASAPGKPGNERSTYLGPSTPAREMSLGNTFTLFKNLRVYGFFDYKGGYYQFDAIKYVNDRLDQNTAAVNDPSNFANGVRNNTVATQVLMSGATDPDIARADFIKLRELSLSYTLPQILIGRTHAKSVALQVSGRNLAIWKLNGYPGIDPEVEFFNLTSNAATSRFDHTDYCSVPMLRRVLFSVNVNY
jgi:TonB-linked SusC/RagA family outer membrane protein